MRDLAVSKLNARRVMPGVRLLLLFMESRIIRETVRVLFHLNGYTKVMVERTEGVGMADGGIVWELSTERIPRHLREIGSRFIVQLMPLSHEEENDPAAIHEAKNRFEIFELSSA